jgi:3-hydroxybutyrate dehydrogenase
VHSLQGKSVLITGAASGIGKACAIAFADSGAHVIAVDLDIHLLGELES